MQYGPALNFVRRLRSGQFLNMNLYDLLGRGGPLCHLASRRQDSGAWDTKWNLKYPQPLNPFGLITCLVRDILETMGELPPLEHPRHLVFDFKERKKEGKNF